MTRERYALELLDRKPPSDAALEGALLGCLIVDLRLVEAIRGAVEPVDFHAEGHGLLFAHLATSFDRGFRVVYGPTMVAKLKAVGDFAAVGGYGHLGEMVDGACLVGEAVDLAKRIRELARRRAAIHTGLEMVRLAYVGDLQEQAA